MAEKSTVVAANLEYIANARSSLSDYVKSIDAVLAALRKHQRAEAFSDLGAVHEADLKVRAALSAYTEAKIKVGAESLQHTRAVNLRQRLLLLAGLLLIAGASIWLSLVILARPLGEAVSVLQDVAKGDFRRRVRIHSGDEVGQVGLALNQSIATNITGVAAASGKTLAAAAETQASARRLGETSTALQALVSRFQLASGGTRASGPARQPATGGVFSPVV